MSGFLVLDGIYNVRIFGARWDIYAELANGLKKVATESNCR